MAAVVALILLALLAIFQMALIGGAPIGRLAWGGQYSILPWNLRIGSIISIFIYAGMAALAVSKAGLLTVIADFSFVQVGLWVCSLYLSFGVLLNVISRSKPERYTMAPTALVLALCFWAITLPGV